MPTYVGTNGRLVRAAEGATFWRTHPAIASERGVYIFAMRSRGGTLPTYVGKATVTFGQETFTPHKLAAHFNVTLVDYRKGTPLLYFLLLPQRIGAPNLRAIDELETSMIAEAIRVNPHGVTNSDKRPPAPLWSITGVVRASQGKPSASAQAFRTAMKL